RLCVEQFQLQLVRLHSGPQSRQPLGRIVQRLLLLAEGEAGEGATVFFVRVEARAGARGDAHFGGHPLWESQRVQRAVLREVGEDEVRTRGQREFEALFAEHAAQEGATLLVVRRNLVVVVRTEREADGGRRLQRRRRADREEVVHLADRSCLFGRRDDPAD